MMNKTVSIYVPTYNRRYLLERAVNSLVTQSYKNLEIIICDDSSTDDTWSFLEEISSNDSRVKILRNTTSMGACFSRNRCIEKSTGFYITGLDDDDYFHVDRIRILVDTLQSKKIKMVSSNYYYINKDESIIGERFEGFISSKMISYRNVIGNQMLCETKFIKELGGFDELCPAWQDYDLWYRLVKRIGECYRVNTPLYFMDISHDQPRITTSSKAYLGYKYFVNKHKNELNLFQKNSLYLEDKTNRGENITLEDLFSNWCSYGALSYIKKKVRNHIPILNVFIKKYKKYMIENKER